MHLYRHLSRFLGRSLDLWGLESEPVCGEILFGVGGGGCNEFQVIIGVHRLSSCTTGRDIERNDKVCQKFIGFISK